MRRTPKCDKNMYKSVRSAKNIWSNELINYKNCSKQIIWRG